MKTSRRESLKVKTKSIGFIGAGNMASAMVKGFLSAKLFRASEMWVSDAVPKACETLKRRYGVGSAATNRELVRGSSTIILAVKPQILREVLDDIRPEVTPLKLFISIAAGFRLERIERALGEKARVVRVMPNTPALVGKGMSALVLGHAAKDADEKLALRLFSSIGEAVALAEEDLLDAVTGLSGSGPAYVYLFAENLIGAGIREGLSEDIARKLAFQTLIGASAMLEQAGLTPEELRAMVSSPGGTTVAGVAALEKAGFGDVVGMAVAAATARSRELGR